MCFQISGQEIFISIEAVSPINCFSPSGYVTIEEFNNVLTFLTSKIEKLESRVSTLESEKAELQETIYDMQENSAINFRRVTVIENSVFVKDEDGEIIKDSEDKPVLYLTQATEKPQDEPKPVVTPTIETTLDQKACAVVEYLKEDIKPNDFGEFLIGRKELSEFLQNIITPDLRVKKVSRQLKADIFKRCVELFSDIVHIAVSKSGNKTKSLALKPSVKRTTTHACTRKTALGIWG